MVSIYKYEKIRNGNDGQYISAELRGLSTDAKPKTIEYEIDGATVEYKVDNGSTFIEIDTQNIYLYDLTGNGEWKIPVHLPALLL